MSALYKRHEQLKRWDNSDTNLASGSARGHNIKVKFQDGCVFLAACSSGDRDEVKKLLERGADINTANVDGLTALHQVDRSGSCHLFIYLLIYTLKNKTLYISI